MQIQSEGRAKTMVTKPAPHYTNWLTAESVHRDRTNTEHTPQHYAGVIYMHRTALTVKPPDASCQPAPDSFRTQITVHTERL